MIKLWNLVGKGAQSVSRHSRSGQTRLLAGQGTGYTRFVAAAKDYVRNVQQSHGITEFPWLRQKPFAQEDLPMTLALIYPVLNLLGAMQLPPRATVLEVGSGPGWLTEILCCCGYSVECLEPAEDMIEVARARVARRMDHHDFQPRPTVRFHCSTLEECPLADESVDGIVFHESLHHVVDEHQGLAQCFRVLRPSGVLGITGEAAWRPGDHEMERRCHDEMRRFGTLENPFTCDYLDDVLTRHGFVGITRFHGINGFFPLAKGKKTLAEAAQLKGELHNNLIALKPASGARPIDDPEGNTQAQIDLLHVQGAGARRLEVTARLTNVGDTVWPNRSEMLGHVTMAMFYADERGRQFLEAIGRRALDQPVRPGESLTVTASYELPATPARGGAWRVDLVSEGLFWFHRRGTRCPEVALS